jgi:PAS domain S-box-containing protein
MLPITDNRKLQFFNELMQNSNVAILVADKDRRNIFVNQPTCKMFGYTEDELIGKSAEIFHISNESYQKFGDIVLNTLLKGEKVSVDYQWKKKDGTIFWGHIAGSVTKESEEVLWTLFDVTDRKEVEAVELKNAQQAQIIEQTKEAVVLTDLDGNIQSWNNGATLLFGYKSQEVLGKHIELLYQNKDIQSFYSGLQNLKKEGSIKKERTLVKKDGTTVDILLSSSLLCNNEGKPTHIIGYAQDITVIKKAQSAILHADMFYALVENAFIAIYIIHDSKFIYPIK